MTFSALNPFIENVLTGYEQKGFFEEGPSAKQSSGHAKDIIDIVEYHAKYLGTLINMLGQIENTIKYPNIDDELLQKASMAEQWLAAEEQKWQARLRTRKLKSVIKKHTPKVDNLQVKDVDTVEVSKSLITECEKITQLIETCCTGLQSVNSLEKLEKSFVASLWIERHAQDLKNPLSLEKKLILAEGLLNRLVINAHLID